MVRAINTWGISLVRYSAGIVEWTQEELDRIDRKTRKLMCIYKILRLRANVSRLYLLRAEGARGLLSIANCVNVERNGLQHHVSSTRERLLKMEAKGA